MTLEYIMIATRISDDGYVTWPSIGSPDPTATFAPINPSLLNLPATVDYTINSPTSNAGGIPFFNAGGDLTGTYPNPTLAKIQNRPIKNTDPTDGQVLTWVSADGYIEWKNSGAGNDNVTLVSSTTYAVLSTNFMLACDPTSNAITINLLESPSTGMILQIKDATGNAGTHNITLSGNGHNIDGASTIVLVKNYENLSIIWNGSQWNVL